MSVEMISPVIIDPSALGETMQRYRKTMPEDEQDAAVCAAIDTFVEASQSWLELKIDKLKDVHRSTLHYHTTNGEKFATAMFAAFTNPNESTIIIDRKTAITKVLIACGLPAIDLTVAASPLQKTIKKIDGPLYLRSEIGAYLKKRDTQYNNI